MLEMPPKERWNCQWVQWFLKLYWETCLDHQILTILCPEQVEDEMELVPKLVQFSLRYQAEVKDPVNKKSWSMSWGQNMTRQSKPLIKIHRAKSGGVKIGFVPDASRFGNPDMKSYMELVESRAVQLAAVVPKSSVFLNGNKIPQNTIQKLAELVFRDVLSPQMDPIFGDSVGLVFDSAGFEKGLNSPGVHFCISPRPSSLRHDAVPNLCFVNGIKCEGTAVNYLLSEVFNSLQSTLAKELKKKRR